jgi:hypothetical protein
MQVVNDTTGKQAVESRNGAIKIARDSNEALRGRVERENRPSGFLSPKLGNR